MRFPVTLKPTTTTTSNIIYYLSNMFQFASFIFFPIIDVAVPQRASVIVYAPSLAVRVLPSENTTPPLPVQQQHREKRLCNPASEQPYTVYEVDRLVS
jgi:hypothetical protein